MQRTSKFLLALEALVLVYPSWLGLLMVGGAIAPVATGSFTGEHVVDAAIGCAVLAGLVCGWRLASAFLIFGRASARGVSRGWWIASAIVATCAVAIDVLYRASAYAATHGYYPFM